jgi:ABC-type lipoprotein release transport system permease subunit
MADLERSSGRRVTRAERQKRAEQLTLATSALTVVAVVGLLLAILGVVSGAVPLIAGALAVVCGVLLRRALSGR